MDSIPTTNVTPTDLSAAGINSASCWVKADPNIHGTNTNDDWYNYTTDNTATRDAYGQPYYTHRKMANAVTFFDTGYLNSYQNAAVGTPIPNGVIAGYWTYVPRYSYKVERFNYSATNFPHAFELILTNANSDLAINKLANINASIDPNVSNPPVGSNPMSLHPTTYQYLTPPAFTFNGQELNGLWFGKYETTGTTTMPFVNPYYPPIVSRSVSTFFESGLQFGNPGLTGSTVSYAGDNMHNFANISKVRSHITKNSEWGVLVYFTNSMYGVCSNMNCTSNNTAATGMAATAYTERVRNNAYYDTSLSRYFLVGCGPNILNSTDDTTTTTCNPYNTQLGVLASTNHNVYGLYDTAGGAWEYTTGVYATGNGSAVNAYTPVSTNSGFTNLASMLQQDAATFSPYFDIYPNPSLTNDSSDIFTGKYGLGSVAITSNYNWNIYAGKLGLGHGMFEASEWSGANAISVGATSSWFIRSDQSANITPGGVESFYGFLGSGSESTSFRGVVALLP